MSHFQLATAVAATATAAVISYVTHRSKVLRDRTLPKAAEEAASTGGFRLEELSQLDEFH